MFVKGFEWDTVGAVSAVVVVFIRRWPIALANDDDSLLTGFLFNFLFTGRLLLIILSECLYCFLIAADAGIALPSRARDSLNLIDLNVCCCSCTSRPKGKYKWLLVMPTTNAGDGDGDGGGGDILNVATDVLGDGTNCVITVIVGDVIALGVVVTVSAASAATAVVIVITVLSLVLLHLVMLIGTIIAVAIITMMEM